VRPRSRLVRLLFGVVVAAAAAGVIAADGRATRECDGLDVCIRVPGPWVAIPAPTAAVRAPSVAYQLSCPPRSVVGGLDAVRSERLIDIVFLGALGSPVNPGITTGRSVVFVATYTGVARRPTAFKPLLGCIPTSGGGGRGTTSVAATAPVEPLLRRVTTVRLGARAARSGSVSCGRRERLLGSSHAVAFRTRSAPSASVLGGVRVARRERGGRVIATARRPSSVPPSARAEVQVHALCGARR
jgi:hypothetical protein